MHCVYMECSWHFYWFSLFQTCVIVFVLFFSCLKHPNKSFFFNVYNIYIFELLFNHTLYLHLSLKIYTFFFVLTSIFFNSCVAVQKYPVLLQGPTSSGKTTMVMYLAKLTGHRCVRINNHEHTDLQEYMGSYVSDPSGKLVFKEGLLVEAVRKGW